MKDLTCFKAYDIRGKVPEEVNEELAYQIGHAFSYIIKPGTVIVGYDVRLESIALVKALIKGLTDSGSNVINIGLCGTEEVYFHTFNNEKRGIGGGIMVTASHNPKGYNGMKMVGQGARPISLTDDLKKIKDFVLKADNIKISKDVGVEVQREDKSAYVAHLLEYVDNTKLKPLKILVNPGNGPAGSIVKLLEKSLPFEFVYIQEEPDGNFPNGVPNPMIIENRKVTSEAVLKHNADFGVAWDGDFDRCFLFDEKGNFIEGYYIVGLLAESFLKKYPDQKIIHDPRLIWNTIDIVKNAGGIPVQSKSGHSFIKEKMRQEEAIYGGEMSAHHYFKSFSYCDSGMLPWLLISELISDCGQSLSDMVGARISKFPCSGEINYKVANTSKTINLVTKHFVNQNPVVDNTDGISLEFPYWRLNLRESNTEPLLRLNIEVNGQKESLKNRIAEVEAVINSNKQ
ncbi:MAG: phosphohexose mutase [Rickettsiaceae bacterium]